MKIYLCGITQNSVEDIGGLLGGVSSIFDGIIFVDHFSSDGTYKLLYENRGAGKIIRREWVNCHDHSMNEFLYSGVMKDGDWFVLRDSSERLNPAFCKKLKDFVNTLEREGVYTVYQRSKLLMAQFNSQMFFLGSPHWGLQNCRPNSLMIERVPGFENDEDYAFSVRNSTRPAHHFIDHDVKYYYQYKRSNHMNLYYGYGEEFITHELNRGRFIKYCAFLGIGETVLDLKNYLRENKLTGNMKEFLNFERLLRNFYRFHVLQHPVEQILKDQEEWRIE